MTNTILSKIESWLVYITAAVIPFIFLPILTDTFELGKQTVLLLFLLLGFGVLLIGTIKTKQLTYAKPDRPGYLYPLLAIIAILLLSSLINSPNRLSSIFSSGSAVSWILISLFFLLATRVNKIGLTTALFVSGVMLGIISLVFSFAPLTYPLQIPLTIVSVSKYFSPTGSLTSQALFLFCLVPIGIALLYRQIKTNKLIKLLPVLLGLILILGGLVGSIYGLINSPKNSLLPQNISWSIALETMKNGRQAILGFGPGQYVNAFTTAKPSTFNTTAVWDTRFYSASNWYFQFLTEVGLVGIAAILVLIWLVITKAFRAWKNQVKDPVLLSAFISTLILFCGLAFLPGSFVTLFLLIILLTITSNSSQETYELKQLGGFIYPLAIFPIAFWGALLYYQGRFVLANHYYYQSIVAANKNDGLSTYNFQAKAITTNPYSPTYRYAYAQTNLALANSIVSNPPNGKELTDTDRSNISQLIQQSIQEAKSTVSLDPRSAFAWESLASVYRNLINFTEGADQWTIQSYQQAILLDPLNPRIRLDLGGVYYNLKQYEQAVNLFSQAASLKPDYANAVYNLANGLREIGNYQNAAAAYENVMSLVNQDSDDYVKVSAELEEVKKKLPIPSPTPTINSDELNPETLSTPVNPPQGINPPLEAPAESEPPASPSATE